MAKQKKPRPKVKPPTVSGSGRFKKHPASKKAEQEIPKVSGVIYSSYDPKRILDNEWKIVHEVRDYVHCDKGELMLDCFLSGNGHYQILHNGVPLLEAALDVGGYGDAMIKNSFKVPAKFGTYSWAVKAEKGKSVTVHGVNMWGVDLTRMVRLGCNNCQKNIAVEAASRNIMLRPTFSQRLKILWSGKMVMALDIVTCNNIVRATRLKLMPKFKSQPKSGGVPQSNV